MISSHTTWETNCVYLHAFASDQETSASFPLYFSCTSKSSFLPYLSITVITYLLKHFPPPGK